MKTILIDAPENGDEITTMLALSRCLTGRIEDIKAVYAENTVLSAIKGRKYTWIAPLSAGFYFFSGTLVSNGTVILSLTNSQAVVVMVHETRGVLTGECLVPCGNRGGYPDRQYNLPCFIGKWSIIEGNTQ